MNHSFPTCTTGTLLTNSHPYYLGININEVFPLIETCFLKHLGNKRCQPHTGCRLVPVKEDSYITQHTLKPQECKYKSNNKLKVSEMPKHMLWRRRGHWAKLSHIPRFDTRCRDVVNTVLWSHYLLGNNLWYPVIRLCVTLSWSHSSGSILEPTPNK